MGEGKVTGHHSNPALWIQSLPKRHLPSISPSLKKAGYTHRRTSRTCRNLPSTPASTCKVHLPLTASSMFSAYEEVKRQKDQKKRLRPSELLLTLPPCTLTQYGISGILLFHTYIFSSVSFPWILHSCLKPKNRTKHFQLTQSCRDLCWSQRRPWSSTAHTFSYRRWGYKKLIFRAFICCDSLEQKL